MSLTISGGGGGGITIETDPTALKIASNLSDLADPNQAIVNLGALGDAPNDGTVYGRQSGEWVSAGGGSFNGGTITTPLYADQGAENGVSGMAVIDPNFESAPRIIVKDYANEVYTQITKEGVSISNLGYVLTLTNSQIGFPDGSVQTTAYTGGGGGGLTANQQRLADAIAALVATPTTSDSGNGAIINVQWAFTSVFNNNSLSYEYPKFIDLMNSGWNGYYYAPYVVVAGLYYGFSYVDSTGIIFQPATYDPAYNNPLYSEPFAIAVTDSVNGGGYTDPTTTAHSFPAGTVSFTPYVP